MLFFFYTRWKSPEKLNNYPMINDWIRIVVKLFQSIFFFLIKNCFHELINSKVIWSSHLDGITKWGLLWLFLYFLSSNCLSVVDRHMKCYLGPYHSELTASRPICAVKHCRAESVVRWGTTREYSGAPGQLLFCDFITLKSNFLAFISSI